MEINIESFRAPSHAPEHSHKESRVDRAAFFTLLGLIFLLPVFFVPQTLLIVSKSVLISTLVAASFFLWLLARMKEGGFSFPKSLVLLSGAVLVLVVLASSIFSDVPQASILGFGYELGTFTTLLTLFVAMFLFSIYFQKQANIFYAYATLLVGFAVSFLYQVGIIIFSIVQPIPQSVTNYIPLNMVGKWTDLAIFFGLILILCLIAIELISLRKTIKALLYGILVLSLIGLAFVNFYLLWIVVGVLSLVVFVYALSFNTGLTKSSEQSSRRLPATSFSVLIVSLLFVLGNSVIDNVRASVPVLSVPNEVIRPSWQETISIGKQSLKEDPILGIGPNRFINAWHKYKNPSINQSPLWNIDFDAGIGLLPTMGISTGILGIVALLAFIGIFLYRGFTAILSNVQGRLSHFLLFSSFIGSLYLWVLTFFYVPNITLLALAFIMTGIFVGALIETGIAKSIKFSFLSDPRIGFVSILALVLLTMGTFTGGYILFQKFLSIVSFQQGVAKSAAGNFDGALVSLDRAASFSEQDIYYRTLVELSLARVPAIVSQSGVSQDTINTKLQAELQRAILNAFKARDLDPKNYQNWISIASTYEALKTLGLEDAQTKAVEAFDQAILLNPKSPALLLARGRLSIDTNREEAKEFINQSLALKSDYTDAIFIMSQIQADEGNLASAIKSAETASILSPNSIGIYFQLGFLRYKNKEWLNAISAFERAIELSSDYSNARYFLGLSYEKIGQINRAIEQFIHVQAFNPENMEVRLILSNLRSGKDPFAGQEIPAPDKRDTPPLPEQ